MKLQLVYCSFCALHNRDFIEVLERLQQRYPHDLSVVELTCMAACDDSPAVLINDQYYPGITPEELLKLVQSRLQQPAQ